MRREARLRYGALLGRHGHQFDARWLGQGAGGEGLLGAGEIGAAADALALYDSVAKLRPFPGGLRGLIPLAAAAMIPFVPVIAIEIPLKDLVLKLLSALV